MFNRSRTTDESASRLPDHRPGSTQLTSAFDRVLDELQAPENESAGVGGPDTGAADEHAETLRAARGAQQRAQELFAMAAEARADATEQAERIVLEAREAADRMRAEAELHAERTREELSAWANGQRGKVDSLVTDILESARRDADNIRAEALRTSMSEAEETARRYVGEAAARGARDAEEIRGQAREVLNRAADLGADLDQTIKDLAASLADTQVRLQDELTAMERLLADARQPTVSEAAVPPVGDALPDATEPPAPVEQGPDARFDRDPERPAERTDLQEGRQLGSMFRQPEPGAE